MSWDTTVNKFMKIANRYCVAKCGLTVEDLPDLLFVCDYASEDMTDKEMSDAAVEFVDDLLEEVRYE